MPAILGPGSVSLETCAEKRKLESTESLSPGGSLSRLAPRTRKLECTESTCSLSRGGVSFGAKRRDRLSKKAVDPSSAGANQSQGGRLHAI
jgi:hypothetical protein